MRAGAVLVLAVLCAGCGRLGFDPLGGLSGDAMTGDDAPDIPPDQIAIRVLGDQRAGNTIEPVANATVTVHEGGTSQSGLTDVDGRIVFDVGGPVEVHAGYTDALGSPVAYLVADAPAGQQIELGADLMQLHEMMVQLPANAMAASFGVGIPAAAGGLMSVDTTSVVTLGYDPAWEGQAVPAVLVAGQGAIASIIDVPALSLENGAIVDLTAQTWSAMSGSQLQVTNLGADVIEVETYPVVLDPATNTLMIAGAVAQNPVAGGTATVDIAAPGAVAEIVIGVETDGGGFSVGYGVPVPSSGPLDASFLLPFIDNLDFTSGSASWATPSSGDASFIAVRVIELDTGARWLAIVPPDRRQVAFPADVGVPVPPDEMVEVFITAIRVPGGQYTEVAPTAARDFGFFRPPRNRRLDLSFAFLLPLQ